MSKPPSDSRFIRLTLTSMSGPLVWALHFSVVYGGQHVACAAGGLGTAPIRWGIIIATLVACLALVLVFIMARKLVQPDPPFDEDVPVFLHSVTNYLLGLSLFAVLASGLAGLILPGCPSLR